MKSLIYQLRDDLIRSFKTTISLFSHPESENKHLIPSIKRELKRIKDPTIPPAEIINRAHDLTASRVSAFEEIRSPDGINITEKYKMIVDDFYKTLKMVHIPELPEGFLDKKYYYFVPDFADNLKKVKAPNFDKLTLNDVFPNIKTHTYLEIILKDEIISIVVSVDGEKRFISGLICLVYPRNITTEIDEFCTPLPTYYGHYGEWTDRGWDEDAGDEGGTLFKDAWTKAMPNKNFFYNSRIETREEKINTQFIASCLLYLQSGDPDIRHMKGENPRKYKINSKDSFFEKRQKQVLSQDAVFNDYELVGWNYKKQYNVAGHWRYQACGPKWSQHKLIFIESFKKGKKND